MPLEERTLPIDTEISSGASAGWESPRASVVDGTPPVVSDAARALCAPAQRQPAAWAVNVAA